MNVTCSTLLFIRCLPHLTRIGKGGGGAIRMNGMEWCGLAHG